MIYIHDVTTTGTTITAIIITPTNIRQQIFYHNKFITFLAA